jgi:lysozyme
MMNSRNLLSALLISLALVLSPSFGSPSQQTLKCFKNCKIDSRGYSLIQNFEGYSPFIYLDAVGIPTIGFGHAIKAGEHFEEPLMGEDAQALLERDVMGTEVAINRMVKVYLLPTQYDALVSFTYNVGTGTLEHSPILQLVNRDEHAMVPAHLRKYVYAGNPAVRLKGLVLRRNLEASTYAAE